MIPLWWNDRTFYQSILMQAGFLVLARVSHMDDWMAHGELEILSHVPVGTHYVYKLNSLVFLRLIV